MKEKSAIILERRVSSCKPLCLQIVMILMRDFPTLHV